MNKTALVTGATNGIGLEFAKILAENKYDLILIARTKSRLDEIKEYLCLTHGIQVFVIACDLSMPGACVYVYEQIKMNSLEIDILINNAGIGDWGNFADSNLEKQGRMLQLNIVALTDLTRLFLPGMIKRRRGKILNVSSTAAFQPGPLMSVYFASKAYVLSLSSAISQELKGSGVSITCLCPGPTDTGFQSKTFPQEIRMTHGKKLPCARKIAQFGYREMLRGRSVAVYGFINRLIALNMRLIPQRITLPIVHFMQATA